MDVIETESEHPGEIGQPAPKRRDTRLLAAEYLSMGIRLPDAIKCMAAELCFYCRTVK